MQSLLEGKHLITYLISGMIVIRRMAAVQNSSEKQNGMSNITLMEVINKILSSLISNSHLDNYVSCLDFNLAGEFMATLDMFGHCLIADVNTDKYNFYMNLQASCGITL